MNGFWIEEKKFGAKKAIYQKKSSSVSAQKLKCPARLNSARKLFGSAQLGKFQLELITSK
jgi:hypothetical protein